MKAIILLFCFSILEERETQPTPPGEDEDDTEVTENKNSDKEKEIEKKKDPPKIKTGKHPSLIKVSYIHL